MSPGGAAWCVLLSTTNTILQSGMKSSLGLVSEFRFCPGSVAERSWPAVRGNVSRAEWPKAGLETEKNISWNRLGCWSDHKPVAWAACLENLKLQAKSSNLQIYRCNKWWNDVVTFLHWSSDVHFSSSGLWYRTQSHLRSQRGFKVQGVELWVENLTKSLNTELRLFRPRSQ